MNNVDNSSNFITKIMWTAMAVLAVGIGLFLRKVFASKGTDRAAESEKAVVVNSKLNQAQLTQREVAAPTTPTPINTAGDLPSSSSTSSTSASSSIPVENMQPALEVGKNIRSAKLALEAYKTENGFNVKKYYVGPATIDQSTFLTHSNFKLKLDATVLIPVSAVGMYLNPTDEKPRYHQIVYNTELELSSSGKKYPVTLIVDTLATTQSLFNDKNGHHIENMTALVEYRNDLGIVPVVCLFQGVSDGILTILLKEPSTTESNKIYSVENKLATETGFCMSSTNDVAHTTAKSAVRSSPVPIPGLLDPTDKISTDQLMTKLVFSNITIKPANIQPASSSTAYKSLNRADLLHGSDDEDDDDVLARKTEKEQALTAQNVQVHEINGIKWYSAEFQAKIMKGDREYNVKLQASTYGSSLNRITHFSLVDPNPFGDNTKLYFKITRSSTNRASNTFEYEIK